MLMGGLNAHIKASELDFIFNDINDPVDDFLTPNYIADNIQKFRNTEVPQTTNQYGKQVLDLCIEAQLRILNGRTIGDTKGKCTLFNYTGVAITDFCICNSNLLENIVNFTVGQFNPVLSDHCPISVKLFSQEREFSSSGLLKPKRRSIKWDSNKELLFSLNVQNMNVELFSKEFYELLELVPQNQKDSLFLHKIDNVVDRFASFLYNAAINQSSDKESSKRRVVRNKQKKKR